MNDKINRKQLHRVVRNFEVPEMIFLKASHKKMVSGRETHYPAYYSIQPWKLVRKADIDISGTLINKLGQLLAYANDTATLGHLFKSKGYFLIWKQ